MAFECKVLSVFSLVNLQLKTGERVLGVQAIWQRLDGSQVQACEPIENMVEKDGKDALFNEEFLDFLAPVVGEIDIDLDEVLLFREWEEVLRALRTRHPLSTLPEAGSVPIMIKGPAGDIQSEQEEEAEESGEAEEAAADLDLNGLPVATFNRKRTLSVLNEAIFFVDHVKQKKLKLE